MLEERAKLAFDADEMRVFANGGKKVFQIEKEFGELIAKHPKLQNTFDFYSMTAHEAQTELWDRIKYIDQNIPDLFKKSQVNEYPFFFWMNRF